MYLYGMHGLSFLISIWPARLFIEVLYAHCNDAPINLYKCLKVLDHRYSISRVHSAINDGLQLMVFKSAIRMK